MLRSRLLAMTLLVLTGCQSIAPTSQPAPRAMQRSNAGPTLPRLDEVLAQIRKQGTPAIEGILPGVVALFEMPSDVAVQRGLTNLIDTAIDASLPKIPTATDESLGQAVIQAISSELPPISNRPEWQQYLQAMADRLTKAAGTNAYQVRLFETSAFQAMNGGGSTLLISTALLHSIASEAELAGIMAHEIAHGQRRHVVQKHLTRQAVQATSQHAAKLQGVSPDEIKRVAALVMALSPQQRADKDFVVGFLQDKVRPAVLAAQVFDVNAYFSQQGRERTTEAEADRIAVRLAARAGFNPNGLARILDRWNQKPTGDLRYREFPDLGTRVAAIRAQIAEENLQAQVTAAAGTLPERPAVLPPPAGPQRHVQAVPPIDCFQAPAAYNPVAVTPR